MISAWTKGASSLEEKQSIERSIRNSSVALRRLYEIITDMEADLNSSELSASNYDSPNWDYKQAHVNGQKATIRTIKRLLTLDPQDVIEEPLPVLIDKTPVTEVQLNLDQGT